MLEEVKHLFFFGLQDSNLAIILIFVLIGVFFAYRLIKSKRSENIRKKIIKGDKAFFQGIQYLLSNETDQAIEQFTKSVQINSDTVETYIALGNLFRSKGDFERAIRIRQGLILRPNLEKDIKLRAILDLGVDYRKGGFLHRAISTFLELLEGDPNNIEALQQLDQIYEDMKDWDNAFKIRQTLTRIVKGEDKNILSHYQTEIGKDLEKSGDDENAEKSYKKAISICNSCVDAYLHLGDLYSNRQEYKKALSVWKKAATIAPQFTFLVYQRLEGIYPKLNDLRSLKDFLFDSAQKNPDGYTHLALARYLYNEGEVESALEKLNHAIELFPSFLDARIFLGEILLKEGRSEEALKVFKEFLLRLDSPYLKFQCSNCGYRPDKLVWKCPQCKKWDSINVAGRLSVGLSENNDSS